MKRVRKLSKKFSAGLLGVTLLASGAAAQNLGDLPQPFVDDDGNLAADIVVGQDAKPVDVVSAIDIAGTFGNDAYSSKEKVVEGSETSNVDGVSKDVTIRGSFPATTVDRSDYSNLLRNSTEDGHYIVEKVSVSGSSVNTVAVNQSVETTVSKNALSYSVDYTPGYGVDDEISLLGENYVITGIDTGAGEVDLGSNMEQNGLELGDTYTHGPYTVEVIDKDESNSEIYVEVSDENGTIKSQGLATGNTLSVDNGMFTVDADSVFFGSQRDYIDVSSTYSQYTLTDGEDSEIAPDYTTGLTFNSGNVSQITLDNELKAVNKKQANLNENEVQSLEAGDSFEGPQGYFTLSNLGLTEETTQEISFSEEYTVEYNDAGGFNQSLDIRNVVTGSSTSLYAFNDGTTTSPTMFVDDGTNAGTYEDGDDILKISKTVGSSDISSATVNDFSSSEYYLASSSGFDGSQPIIDDADTDTALDDGEVDRSGTSGILTATGSNLKYAETSGDSQYTGDGSGGYQDPIYTSSNAAVDNTATRENSVTVSSTSPASTGNIGRNLGSTNPAQVASADFDAAEGFSLNSLTGTWKYVEVATAGYTSEDYVVYDTDSSSAVSSGDIVFPNSGNPYVASGTNTDTFAGTVTFNGYDYDQSGGADGTYGSGDNVVLDFATDTNTGGNAFEAVDYDLTAGSYSPASSYDGNLASAGINYWNSDDSSGYTGDKSIYVDADGSGTINQNDVRAVIFSTQTYSSGAVTSDDADVGVSISSVNEYYLENSGDSSYTVGSEALVRSSDTNLDTTDTVVVSGGFSNSQQTFTAGQTMYVGASGYDGSQDILSITRETNGGSDVALDGKNLNNFGSLIKHTTSGQYADGDAIVNDADDDDVYDSSGDTVITGSISGGGLFENGGGDKDIYTDVDGHPVRIQFDDANDEATVSYQTYESTVSVGDGSTTHETGYGFSFTTSFDTTGGDGNEDFTLSSSDATLNTQFGAKLRQDGSSIDVEEDGDGSFDDLVVGYDGSNQVSSLDSTDFSQKTSDTETISNFGTEVSFSPEGSAEFSYPDNQRYSQHAVGEVGTSQSGSDSYTEITPTGVSDIAALDTEASTDQPLVLVGGPAVNDLTSTLAENDKTWSTDQYTEGEGLIQLVDGAFNSYDALVVSGQSGEDTRAAGEFLSDYQEHLDELEGQSQVSIDTSTGEIVE